MARSSGRSAALVAAGIFLSRIAGLVRQRVFAHYLGLSDAADALTAAFRIPNLLQNLFGEGVLSASFVPVYARLVAEDKAEDARLVAGAVAGLLALVVALVVAIGVVTAPLLVGVLVPGFEGPKRELAVALVRILFPATAVLVLSAWCLGILNSHGRFFLSYAAPVAWNLAIIVVTIWAGRRPAEQLVVAVAWGAVAGSVLQLGVQLPATLRLLRGLRLSLDPGHDAVRRVVVSFGPAFLGRGVNQISAFVDAWIASFLGRGAVAAVSNAQMLYTLPVSLFGMAVSAAELPAMASVQGSDDVRAAALRQRLAPARRRIAFLVLPCAVAFLALGQVIAGGVFQTGRFDAADARYVWAILAGSAVGLLAATQSRLLASACYAMGDPGTPLRFAALRVATTAALGSAAALLLPRVLGLEPRWGAAGLATASGLAAWLEYELLQRALGARIGIGRLAADHLVLLTTAAGVAALAGWGAWTVSAPLGPVVAAVLVCLVFGTVYLGACLLLRVEEARALVSRTGRG